MLWFFLKYLCISLILSYVNPAKILAIFPSHGQSQYITVERYLKTLAERGHAMTVITAFPQEKPFKNFREIKITYEGYEDFIMMMTQAKHNADTAPIYLSYSHNLTVNVFENFEVQQMLKDPQEHFDLVIVDAEKCDAWYGFGPHFNAHLIGYSSYGTDRVLDDLVGNVSPLSSTPSVMSRFTNEMDFWQRLQNFFGFILERTFLESTRLKDQRILYEKYFPHLNHLPFEDVRKNFSLIFLNQHFSISFARPYVPNMIEVAGMHIDYKPKQLPGAIQDFIDGAENGVIYFSLGSSIQGKFLSKEKREIFLKVFGTLKERILWKFEETDLLGKPGNVFISKWFPQADILSHPKVKLFITHCGLLSTMEAIFHAKPILGMPVCFDQFFNLALAKAAGYGIGLDFQNLNVLKLQVLLDELLSNSSYTKAAQQISARFHDQPIKPLETAIFWTEYVLRHNGSHHMRFVGRNLNFFQFYCLDCIAFILSLLFLIVVLMIYLGFTIMKYLQKKTKAIHMKKHY